jgi:HSP20 family protein
MSIPRWDPLRDLLTLQERMNRLFEESLLRGRPHEPALESGSWSPLADVYETPESFVVLVELPGLSQDDVELQVDADQLVVRGERRMGVKTRPESFHRMERSYGYFSRTFPLPEDVDPARLTAQFRDGLLRLDLPKARPRSAWGARLEDGEE